LKEDIREEAEAWGEVTNIVVFDVRLVKLDLHLILTAVIETSRRSM